MKLNDFSLSITVAACVTSAALVANIYAGPKERAGPIDLDDLRAKEEARFTAVDANGDGLVSAEEFATVDHRRILGALRHRGERDRGGARPRAAVGEHDGVDREAVRSRMELRRADREEREREARIRSFETADADDDGQLSAQEYADLPATANAERRRRLFTRLDQNEDGSLTPDEFPSLVDRLQTLDADSDGLVTRDEMRAGRGR